MKTIKKYESKLSLHETQVAIEFAKDFFEKKLAQKLKLFKVCAPLLVESGTGIQDTLSGEETPLAFVLEDANQVEVVHSLAKWKRLALYRYGVEVDTGIYTDMTAIRKDEKASRLHSYFVDQWDWEKVMKKEDRHLVFLKKTVQKIYEAIKEVEAELVIKFPVLTKKLPSEIHFISSQCLEDQYPLLTPKQREDKVCKEYGAVCLIGIGAKLLSGERHDIRAADYDDWKLNCDILLYSEELDKAIEISSMAIRVDKKRLRKQLEEVKEVDKRALYFHKLVLEETLPDTIGGGIGQSRLMMFLLEKRHIGEVQCSVWPTAIIKEAEKDGIVLL